MELFYKKIPIYYVYYSYEEWGRGYIGYRKLQTSSTPETEDYFGSYTDKTFKPTKKLILGVYFTVKEAQLAEYRLHKFYNVVKSTHFANKVATGQTGKLCGVESHSEVTKQKIREKAMGRKCSQETKKLLSSMRIGEKNSFYNKSHSSETKNKLSKQRIGSGNPSWNSGFKRSFYNANLGIYESSITIAQLFRKYPELKENYTPQGFSKSFSRQKLTYKDWEISQDNQQPSTEHA
jgi:hypothetical protein